MNLAATLLLDSIRREVDLALCSLTCVKLLIPLIIALCLLNSQHTGIVDNELELFTDYLFQRQQVVYLGSCTSDLRPVCPGVPQGFILGPLLFIILYNDFVDSIHASQVLM